MLNLSNIKSLMPVSELMCLYVCVCLCMCRFACMYVAYVCVSVSMCRLVRIIIGLLEYVTACVGLRECVCVCNVYAGVGLCVGVLCMYVS